MLVIQPRRIGKLERALYLIAMPYDAPDLASLTTEDILRLGAGGDFPPVQDWDPQAASDSLMRIDAEGRWYHDGGPINRPAMVRAFSRLLRLEKDGRFALVVPYEKQWIAVEDAPFQAVEMRVEGSGEKTSISFRLNTDDIVVAGPGHALRPGNDPDAPRLYLHVRHGLEARLTRAVYYELVELALATDPDHPGIWSGGSFFTVEPSA